MGLHPTATNDPTGVTAPYLHIPGFAGTSAQRIAYTSSYPSQLYTSVQWYETNTKNTYQWVGTSSGGWQPFGVISGTSSIGITALTSDVTANGPGSSVATLATVNANVGTFGSAANVAVVTVNGKGLVTAVGTSTISVSASYKAPTVQTFLGGASTYITPNNPAPIYLKVAGIGGGGGGAGSGSGTSGGLTIFGTSLLVGTGGQGGPASSTLGGAGGTASVNSPAIKLFIINGAPGQGGSGLTGSDGGSGGCSPFGGFGYGGGLNTSGVNAIPNTGSGGGGVGGSVSLGSAAAGGAGAYFQAIVPSPSTSYSYSVGLAGNGGASGGANGGSGLLVVEEFYQ